MSKTWVAHGTYCLIVETSSASEEVGERAVETVYGPFDQETALASRTTLLDWYGGENEATVTIAELVSKVPGR